jgi:predicted enzyme related to lactoylglutathione lyase
MVSLNTVCWADIPVKNLDRAIAFYTALLGSAVSKEGEGELPSVSYRTVSKMLRVV